MHRDRDRLRRVRRDGLIGGGGAPGAPTAAEPRSAAPAPRSVARRAPGGPVRPLLARRDEAPQIRLTFGAEYDRIGGRLRPAVGGGGLYRRLAPGPPQPAANRLTIE